VKDAIDCPFDVYELRNIVLDEFKSLFVFEVREVFRAACKHTIEADYAVSFGEQPVRDMGAKKPRSAGNQTPRHK
jgi:hypothetical protein